MSNNIFAVFLMAMMLISSGCLDSGDDEVNQETDNDDKQEPVGETNMTSLEKRIINLEAIIADYEQPKVFFQEFKGDSVSFLDGSVNLADNGNLYCSYVEYYNENRCNLAGVAYDVNGIIEEFSWESSKSGKINYANSYIYGNNDSGVSYAFGAPAIFLNVCDTDFVEPVNQTLTLTVYDNDGNNASVSYDLDYDSVCTVEEPDNTCASDSDCPPGTICQGDVCVEDNLNVCEDGEQYIDFQMQVMYVCFQGQWGESQSIPNGTPCDDGDDYTINDVYEGGQCSGEMIHQNSPPTLSGATITPSTAFEFTTLICTGYGASDDDGDAIELSFAWAVNQVQVGTSNMLTGSSFDKGDVVSCTITPNDGKVNGVSVTSSSITIQNSLPTVLELIFDPEPVTNETTSVCLQYSIDDEDNDLLEILASWSIDGDIKEDLGADECFDLSNYYVESGMVLKVSLSINDGEDQVTETYSVVIEEETDE